MEYRDFRGTTIEPGDNIVYPVKRGNDLHLKLGIVLELTSKEDKDSVGMKYPALRIETLAKNNDPTKIRTKEPKYVKTLFTSLHRCVVVGMIEA